MANMFKPKTVKHATNNYKTLGKYHVKKDPMTKVCHVDMGPFDLKVHGKQIEGRFYYGVRIVTGCQGTAGTASQVYMQLIGTEAQTGEIDIGDNRKVDQSSDTTFDDYIIECEGDLGEVQLVTLGNNGQRDINSKAGWYVDFTFIVNLQTSVEETFPCYHWIGDGDSFTESAHCVTLKQIQNFPLLVQNRTQQVKERQEAYVWLIFRDSGLPSGIFSSGTGLPLDEKLERDQSFLGNFFKGLAFGLGGGIFEVAKQVISASLGKDVDDYQTADSLHTFYEIAKSLETSEKKATPGHDCNLVEHSMVAYEGNRWITDVEFGRHILNGANCVLIELCTELPYNFPVTNEMVQHILCRGKSLQMEMKEGYVYICNLSEILDGLLCREGYYCAAPLCLLYVNPAGNLVPIAIQLQRIPGEDNPIFLPTDHWLDWLLAKMYFSNSSAQHHQLSSHYIACHATMEAYGVATMRSIPDAHPVYKLIRPAFRNTMSINTNARRKFIGDGGLIDQIFSIGSDTAVSGKNELLRRISAMYNVHSTNIKKNLITRGVGDADKLPNYYYRDDGVKLWDAIESYVESIIHLFYSNDADVEEDTELKDWACQVHNFGFPSYRTLPPGRGFPQQIKSRTELIEYCTLIIFTASVQHSAVNFGQFQSYGYVPNSPLNMRKPVPTQKNVATQEDLLESLPTVITTGLSIAFMYSLAQFNDNEIFLGGYPTMWFTGEKEKACVADFLDSLKVINADIIERNNKLDVPYIHLLPQRCPNSITI